MFKMRSRLNYRIDSNFCIIFQKLSETLTVIGHQYFLQGTFAETFVLRKIDAKIRQLKQNFYAEFLVKTEGLT